MVKKPTIIIFCYPNSTYDFETVENKVIEVLDMTSQHIYLEFLPGSISASLLGGREPVVINGITQKPLNGSSIGIQGNNNRAGSLGGWCFLNLPKENRRIPCAMTGYSVIRSDEESISNFTDTAGIKWTDERGRAMAEYPAAFDVPTNMRRLNNQCAYAPHDNDLQKEREILSSLTANPGIGKVLLASGYQIRNNRRLDWALIESPSTLSQTNRRQDQTSEDH